MPGDRRNPSAMPNTVRLVSQNVRAGVRMGLSGRESAELVLGVLKAVRTDFFTAVRGNGAQIPDLEAWLTRLQDAASAQLIANKRE